MGQTGASTALFPSHYRSTGPGQSPGRGWHGLISTSALILGNGKDRGEMCTYAYMQVCACVCSKYVYVHPHTCMGNMCPGQWKHLKEGMQMVTASQGKRKDTSWKEEGQAGLRRGGQESVHRKERREGGQEHSHTGVTVKIGAEGAGPQGGGRVAAASALNQHERWKMKPEVSMFSRGLGPCGTAIPSDRAKQGHCHRLQAQALHTGMRSEHSHFSFTSSTSTLSIYQDSMSKKPHT